MIKLEKHSVEAIKNAMVRLAKMLKLSHRSSEKQAILDEIDGLWGLIDKVETRDFFLNLDMGDDVGYFANKEGEVFLKCISNELARQKNR